MGAPEMGMLLDLALRVTATNGDGGRSLPNDAVRPHDPEVKPLPDPSAEGRRQRVLDLLATNPTAGFALLTEIEADPKAVILALAIRGRATCELRIPRSKYDPFLLLALIERHGVTGQPEIAQTSCNGPRNMRREDTAQGRDSACHKA